MLTDMANGQVPGGLDVCVLLLRGELIVLAHPLLTACTTEPACT
jgi:hypothetical protein